MIVIDCTKRKIKMLPNEQQTYENNSRFTSAAQEVYLMEVSEEVWKKLLKRHWNRRYGHHPEFLDLCQRIGIEPRNEQ